ncbi:MAG: porin family protein [Prolixibacteraceae bacterium]|nr:porin family protein [Prolixibacteraceae bacterium]
MKKQLYFFAALLIIMVTFNMNVAAQVYFKAGVGYGSGNQKLILDESYGLTYSENVYASFGGNLGLYVGAGLQLNDFMDFEIDLGYQNGRSKSVNSMYFEKTYVGKLLYISPSFVFRTSISEDVSPYAKLGVFTGMPLTKVLVNSDEKKFRGGLPLGFNGAIGADYNMNGSIKIFGEIYHQSMVYKPKKRKELDGTVVKFKDQVDDSTPGDVELVHHLFSYGALGVNIGVKLLF